MARRYGDAEIAQLLERAADLQTRFSGASAGLTLDDASTTPPQAAS